LIYWDPVGCRCVCTGSSCGEIYGKLNRPGQSNTGDAGTGGKVSKPGGPDAASGARTGTGYGEIFAAITALLAF
jgi:hypothetical protein